MSEHGHEQGHQPSYTEQVMSICEEAYTTLGVLLDELPYALRVDRGPESEALTEAIEEFVAANSGALGDIGEVPKTPELQEAANVWLEAKLEYMLKSAMLSEIIKRKKEEIEALLEGRTIKATSLQYGFGVNNGFGTTASPGSPKEVEAPFLAVKPAQGVLWLGEPGNAYEVHLFDFTDHGEPAVVIEVR